MSSLNMLLLLCCVWFIYDMDYGEAVGGRQKRTIPEVNLTITERKGKTKFVKIGHPLQGLCSTPAGQSSNIVFLRIYFEDQSRAESLEAEYLLNLSDGKFADVKPSRKTTAVKYAGDGTVNAIAFKVCVSTSIKIHCIAKDSNGNTVGLKIRIFEVEYEPMRPNILVKPHLDGTLLLNIKTKVHCIAYVGTQGRLEMRIMRPYSFFRKLDKWIIYFDSLRVETNFFLKPLRYWKGFNYYGPYILARVEVEVEQNMECKCFAINAALSREKWKKFPKQIETSIKPRMYYLDDGKILFGVCTSSNFGDLPDMETALFYKDTQGTVIYKKEKGKKHQVHQFLNASYTGMQRQIELRNIQFGLQIKVTGIENRTTFTLGCVLNSYQLCRNFTRNLTKLASTEDFLIIANAMMSLKKAHKKHYRMEHSPLSFGQFALIAVGLGVLFGIFLMIITKVARGAKS